MLFKLSNNSKTERILLVSLSNIGDIVLTFPVFDSLRESFPKAEITVIVGPKGKDFFITNPHVFRTVIYEKSMTWWEKSRWLSGLRRQAFDLIVDLRNSMLPFLLRSRFSTRPEGRSVRCHMKDKHLLRLRSVLQDPATPRDKYSVCLSDQDRREAGQAINGMEGFVLVAPGAAHPAKRWNEEGFAGVIRHLTGTKENPVVVVGDNNDLPIAERILRDIPGGFINLCSRTTLTRLACIVSRAKLAVTNDSGIMHLASYFNIPTLALFGPTDPFLYGPWSDAKEVIRNSGTMDSISPDEVIRALDRMLTGSLK